MESLTSHTADPFSLKSTLCALVMLILDVLVEMSLEHKSETSWVTCTKEYVTNDDDNIIRVHSTSVILFISMTDIYFVCV